MSSDATNTQQGSGPAVRLIVEYDGDRLRLVSQQRVDMALPGADVSGRGSAEPGHYAVVRDSSGETLASVQISDAPTTSVEVFPDEPEGPITRTDVDRAQGAFTVVVPAAPSAREVAIIRVPLVGADEATAAAALSEELATFALEAEG